MDQSDIKYVLEILTDAKTNKDWDAIEDAIDTLKEFLEYPTNEGEDDGE